MLNTEIHGDLKSVEEEIDNVLMEKKQRKNFYTKENRS